VFTNWPKKADDESNPGPPDAPKSKLTREIIAEGREWIGTILSRFGPVKERAQAVTTLDFEKPLLELDKRIKEVGRSHVLVVDSLTQPSSLILGLSRSAKSLPTMAST